MRPLIIPQYFLFFLWFFSPVLFATTGHLYISGLLGSASANVGQANPHIKYFDGALKDSYPLTNARNNRAIGGLKGGYEWIGRGMKPAIALGLGAYTSLQAYQYHGHVYEMATGDPSFLLYNYQEQIKSTRLMAEAEFIWEIKKFSPFINIGIGPSWNQFSHYSEQAATSNNYVVYPPFQSRTITQFAYQLGLGIGYGFNFCHCCDPFLHERIALAYQYANLGNVSSGIRNAEYPFKLNLGKLTTNSIYLAYTHLF